MKPDDKTERTKPVEDHEEHSSIEREPEPGATEVEEPKPTGWAAQLRQIIDALFGHDRVGDQIIPAAERNHRHTLQVGLHQSGRRAGCGIDVAGDQSLICGWRAIDADRLDG